jgi:molybdate transport repressor ModE-like protein
VSNLDLRQLRAFVALADSGSITAASRAVGVAQSTLSEALAALERAVSTPLLQRRGGTQGTVLTAAGHALLDQARRVLAAVDELHVAVADAVASARGTVEIVAPESISTYVLPRILANARQRWPNTQFPVSVGTCADVRGGVARDAFDVGFVLEAAGARRTHMSLRDIVAPIVELVAFALPTHPLPQKRVGTVDRDMLAQFPVFLTDAAGDFNTLIERSLRSDLRASRLQSTGSVEGLKAAVLADRRAVGVLPAYAVAKELDSGTVIRLDVRPILPNVCIVALFPQTGQRHPSIDELINGVRAIFAAPGEQPADQIDRESRKVHRRGR